jgi:hypothetical protein
MLAVALRLTRNAPLYHPNRLLPPSLEWVVRREISKWCQ